LASRAASSPSPPPLLLARTAVGPLIVINRCPVRLWPGHEPAQHVVSQQMRSVDAHGAMSIIRYMLFDYRFRF
jgi:hypothetical protein